MNGNQFQQLKDNLAHHYRMIMHLQAKHRAETGRDFCPAEIGAIEIPAHRSGCEIYTPDDAQEIEVHYTDDKENGIYINDIMINGQEMSETVYNFLAERDWESEIEAVLTMRAEESRDDKLIESFEIRQLEGMR